jgi:serine/threonine protein kinase
MSELRNPTDLNYLGEQWPKHDDPAYGQEPPFIANPEFLTTVTNGFSPFAYEAAIALGLSACTALTNDLVLTGESHHSFLATTEFDSISGKVVFDKETGTRDPSSALYKVANYLEEEIDGAIAFKPVITNLFQDSQWNNLEDYIFNDGTSNLPVDVAPPLEERELSLAILVGGPVLLTAILGLVYILIREHKRKSNDSVWQVKKEELKFGDTPEVLGRGTFGLVLLAEYRGTQVAVKRAIPPKNHANKGAKSSSMFASWFDQKSAKGVLSGMEMAPPTHSDNDSGTNSGMQSDSNSGMHSGSNSGMYAGNNSGMGSWAGMGSKNVVEALRGHKSLPAGQTRKDVQNFKKLKADFMEEMRHLSRLRHPCVTTVMGAVIEKGEDPMLIMEYMDHGSLYDILHNETLVMEGELLLPILRDVSQGVRFLHSADPQVIHGDLKAANILVDNRFRAKVADFGLAQKRNMGGTGTPLWMAPELLRGESPNTAATDVYSFGSKSNAGPCLTKRAIHSSHHFPSPVILYEVYSRRDPYEGERSRDVLRAVADKNVRKRPPDPQTMPAQIKSLMSDCLEEEPEKRPSFEELDMRLKRIDSESVAPFQSKAKSHVSLFDIFPRHVAEALRDGRKVEAEHKDVVTM